MDLKLNSTLAPVGRTIRRAASGEQYNQKADVWGPFISGGRAIRFDFRDLVDFCDPFFVDTIKQVLTERMEEVATATAANSLAGVNKAVKMLIRNGQISDPIKVLTTDHLNFLAMSLEATSSKKLFSFFKRCKNLFTKDAYDHLFNGGVSHQEIDTQDVVMTLDPTRGPYLDAEILAVDNALLAAFEANEIDRHRYLLIMTFRLYGIRPVTCSEITLGDIDLSVAHSVRVRFRVNKQHNAETAHSPFRPAPMLYGSLLREEVASLSKDFTISGWQELPLFPYEHETWSGRRHHTGGQNFNGFASSSTVGERYQQTMGQLNIISPRTGEKMVISARRDRHTVATQLALQGCSAEVIAAWMLHKDTASCEVYVELATKHYQMMDSLLDGKFTHFAGRFFGKLISAKDLDQFEDSGIIEDAEGIGNEVGGCATGGCSAIETLSAPYACFTCPSFRLSRSADLNPLLNSLLIKRKLSSSDGQTEYLASLDRHIAATHAAKMALEAYDE